MSPSRTCFREAQKDVFHGGGSPPAADPRLIRVVSWGEKYRRKARHVLYSSPLLADPDWQLPSSLLIAGKAADDSNSSHAIELAVPELNGATVNATGIHDVRSKALNGVSTVV